MLVTEAQLEASLERLERGVENPRAGVFGPGSAFWGVQRHSWIFLGAGRASLLQLAHPFVAHAIADHSGVLRRPWLRFQRTFRQMFEMVWGDLPAALAAARTVHRVHRSIRGELPAAEGAWPAGTHYEANDRDALIWVHATLWDSSLRVYESIRGPFPPAERARYYRDTLRFASLFGIPESALPADHAAFQTYCARMWSSGALHVSPSARAHAQALLAYGAPPLQPVLALHRLLTAHWLPPAIREAYELPWSAARERLARTAIRAIGATERRWPSHLRELPACRAASDRVRGIEHVDRLDSFAQRLLIGT